MPAPKGNRYAAKPATEKRSFKGRITFDAGPLKNRCVKAARAQGLKLTAWLRAKLDQAARDDGY